MLKIVTRLNNKVNNISLSFNWNRNINMLRATNWEELNNMIKIIENTIDNNKLNKELISRETKVGDNER